MIIEFNMMEVKKIKKIKVIKWIIQIIVQTKKLPMFSPTIGNFEFLTLFVRLLRASQWRLSEFSPTNTLNWLVKTPTIGNACYLACIGPTSDTSEKRAVHLALREGSFLLSCPDTSGLFLFHHRKKKEEKKDNDWFF